MSEKIEIIKKINYVELVSDETSCISFKDGKEIVELKTPKYLEQYLFEKIDLSKLKRIILLTCLVPNGRYNSVSDKKGIWSIINQAEGLFQDSYICENGKIYFGITDKLDISTINGFVSYIEVFLPTNDIAPCEKIFDIFSATKYDMSSNDLDILVMEEIRKNIVNSISVQRTSKSIKISGDKIESLF